jgi:hypothetical protein
VDNESKIGRRDLLKAAAGLTAGAAIVGVPAWVIWSPDSAPASDGAPVAISTGASMGEPSDAPLIAYIQDAAKGEVVIMTGAEQVVLTDPALVSRLLGATKG